MTETSRELELLGRQLTQVHRAALQRELETAGLGEIGHPVLLSILESSFRREGRSCCPAQRELAELLHVSPAAVTASLKSLERGGYIRREPEERDARRNRVTLTEKGSAAVLECREAFERVFRRMTEGFTLEEKQWLISARRRMIRNLSRPAGGDRAEEKEEG